MKKTILLFCIVLIENLAVAQNPLRKGKDYAVFFYVTEFDNSAWQSLPETETEAKKIGKELHDNFGFIPEYVPNPNLALIKSKLKEYNSRSYNADDQILFFFSMHGYFDDNTQTGYLVPRDGDNTDFETWFDYSKLRTYLSSNSCKHIYLALDACNSGSFKLGDKSKPEGAAYDKELSCDERIAESLRYKSRIFAAAGNKTARTPAQSKMASKFLETLRKSGNNGIISADEMNLEISRLTAPRPVTGTFIGHDEGGDFVFVRKNACAGVAPPPVINDIETDKADWHAAKQANNYQRYLDKHPTGLYVDEAREHLKEPPSPLSFPIEPEMIFVKGGTFELQNKARGKTPITSVTLNDYYIGKYEITQAQWEAIMGNNPSEFKGNNLPVERVSWDDIQIFLDILNSKTKKKYRLPTIAEWDFAVRGGVNSKNYIYSGSNELDAVGWYKANSLGQKTHPIGQKAPNELGIYDMSGNVWEWCEDLEDKKFFKNQLASKLNGRTSESGDWPTFRGGSSSNDEFSCRNICGYIYAASSPFDYMGFRVVLSHQ